MNNWNMRGVACLCAYTGRIHSVADSGCEPASWLADRTFCVTAGALPVCYRFMFLKEIVRLGISFS
ncbi:hypothetical protein [Paraburkholderia elongata]|nr:hypothetical protein [Paraburkholderia elongata]